MAVSFRSLVFSTMVACTVGGDEPSGGGDGAGGKADGQPVFVVNGHALTARERQWMQYVADRVIPDLPGTRDRRLEIASRTAWWSLKEGIFDTANAPEYSNCNSSSGDHVIGPLDGCGSGRAWQVGLAAVQVPNHTLTELETLAQELYPGEISDEVLADAAAEAGFAPTSATAQAIVASTGSLRKSWLLRNSAIGFTACERNEVVPECIDHSDSWCFGTGWDTTRWYAPNRAAAMRAIGDISRLLGGLTDAGPQPVAPWIGSTCATDADCGYSSQGRQGFCFVADGMTAGFCSLVCEGYCPDLTKRAPTFCVAKATGGGMCTVKVDPANHECADLPGTQPYVMDRYVGTSSVPAATADVCAY